MTCETCWSRPRGSRDCVEYGTQECREVTQRLEDAKNRVNDRLATDVRPECEQGYSALVEALEGIRDSLKDIAAAIDTRP